MSKQTPVGNWIAAVALVLAIAAGGVYLARKAATVSDAPMVASQASNTSPLASAITSGPSVQHPIDQAQTGPASASSSPLPALDGSDESVADGLIRFGGGGVADLLVHQRIIERIVATVDALPRHEALGSFALPARTPKGPVLVDEASGSMTLAATNSERYAPYLQVVEATDPQALVAWYVRDYPLFQQAYQQLGYPKGYFNDRLIVVIDDLLAAPAPAQPPGLLRSKSYYVYADPALESLSTGQKLMMRLGPEAEARIKTKLRVIRAQLVGKDLRATSAG